MNTAADRLVTRARPLPRPRTDLVAQVQPHLDLAFPIVALVSLLFQLQFGAPMLLVFIAATAGYIALRPREWMQALGRSSFLLLIPLTALASTLWSIDRAATLRASVQLALTLFASFAIGSSRNMEDSIVGVFVATGLYILTSFMFGHSVLSAGEVAFSGLNGGKNFMAENAGTAAIAASGALIIAATRRRAGLLTVVLIGMALDLYVVALARSAGTVVAIGIALAAFYALAVFSGLTRTQRVTAVILLALIVTPVLLNISGISAALTDSAFRFFKKDSSLTGRVYLWYRAHIYIREAPLLGRGYGAFWRQGNADAEGLWAYFSIANRSGFNFHNAFFENMVNMGYVGTALFFTAVAGGVASLAACIVRSPSVPIAFWSAYSIYELSRSGIEALGPLPFSPTTMLLVAAFTAAGTQLSRRRETTGHAVGPRPARGFDAPRLGRAPLARAPRVVVRPVRSAAGPARRG